LGRHLAFYPAASKRFTQVQQILHHHIFCKILRVYISIINEEIAQLRKIIADSEWTIVADR
jgi:hypothetical protein